MIMLANIIVAASIVIFVLNKSNIDENEQKNQISINEKFRGELNGWLIEPYEPSPINRLRVDEQLALQNTFQQYKAARQEQDRLAELERQRKLEEERKRKEAEKREKAKQVSRSNQKVLRTFTVKATGYVSTCKGCTGWTKSGKNVQNTIYHKGNRIIAVDPSVIPLYSIVQVEYEGTSFVAYALDIGGGINFQEIDILMSSVSEANKFGVKYVTIKILREGKGN